MHLIQKFVFAIILIAIAGTGYAAYKLSNPSLPAPEKVTKFVQLDQGWTDAERQSVHYTPQGTLLLPLAWLKAAEQGFFSSKSLIDAETLAGLRFLTDGLRKDAMNPEGLPIGWTVARWASPNGTTPAMDKVGFTCATCHTGQLNYKGTAILIEGAGALHDAGAYQTMVGKSMLATWLLPWKKTRFVDAVTRETGQSRADVETQLKQAFDLAFTATKEQVVKNLYVEEGYGRLDALQRIANTLLADDTGDTSNNRHGDAPVKFPYLWDIWRLDWVQYNASVRQPMARNIGEALGVRAETNFVDKAGNPQPLPERWKTSVMVANLAKVEDALQKLQPPKWPAAIFGPVDEARAARGRALFEERCAGCHGIHVDTRMQPAEWRVTQIPLEKIGTDPNEAMNFIKNRYSAKPLGMDKEIDGAEALRVVANAVKTYAYDAAGYTPMQRAAADGFGRQNEVVSPAVYKARPLVGIWASPPYLHNGSVPTLYDLLSPERPASFYIGTREYDPVKVGFITEQFQEAQRFDTKAPGNSNMGHWFANDERAGRLGRELSLAERNELIEYLKRASYGDYPCRDAQTRQPLSGAVCGGP